MSFFHRATTQAKRTARNIALLLIGAFVAAIVLAFAGLYYFRDPILKATVIPRISKVTGFKADVETLHHEFPLKITLTNVTLENAKGFKPKIFATAPYFYIDIDLEALLEGKVFRIREWDIAMSSLNLERNKEGVINGTLMKAIKNFMSGRGPEEPGGGAGTTSSMDFYMDRLTLRIDRISYRDRTGVVPKSLKKLKLSAHIYNNTESFGDLVDIIEDDVLKEMQLGKRVEMSPFYIERSLKKAADTVVGTTEKLAEGAGKVVKTTAVTGPTEIFKSTAGMMGIKVEKEVKEIEGSISQEEASRLLQNPEAPLSESLPSELPPSSAAGASPSPSPSASAVSS